MVSATIPLVAPRYVDVWSWTSGFIAGFLAFGVPLFLALVKWPTLQEIMEMRRQRGEGEEARACQQDEGHGKPKISAMQKDDAQMQGNGFCLPASIANEDCGKIGDHDDDDFLHEKFANETRRVSVKAYLGRASKQKPLPDTIKQASKPKNAQEDLVALSASSKAWTKDVGPCSSKFFHEFVKAHKSHESNLRSLASTAESISLMIKKSAAESETKVDAGTGRVEIDGAGEADSPAFGEGGDELEPRKDKGGEASWWNAVATALSDASIDYGSLVKVVNNDTAKKMEHLQMEQIHLQTQVEKESQELLKKQSEAHTSLEQAKKEKTKAQVAVERLLSSVAGSSAPVAPKVKTMQGFMKKIGGSKEVNEGKATDQSKRLFRRLQECELEVKAAERLLTDAMEKVETTLPTYVEDLKLLESTRSASLKGIMVGLVEAQLKNAQDNIEVSRRLKVEVESVSFGGFSTLVREGEKELDAAAGERLGQGVDIDMFSDGACALAAMKPANLSTRTAKKLKEASIGGKICLESAVWLNAFSGRIYRDASNSFQFRAKMEKIMTGVMNKGKKPRYVGKFKVTEFRLGEVPPVVKNATWVPPVTLSGSDFEYDAAADMDVIYRGSVEEGNPNISFRIETHVWLGQSVYVPIKVTLTLAELGGKIRIGVKKDESFCSFMSNPHVKFKVKSDIGHSLYLKDVPFVERKIVNMVKKNIEKKLVWPKCMRLALFWPKAWHPSCRGADGDVKSCGVSDKIDLVGIDGKRKPSSPALHHWSSNYEGDGGFARRNPGTEEKANLQKKWMEAKNGTRFMSDDDDSEEAEEEEEDEEEEEEDDDDDENKNSSNDRRLKERIAAKVGG